MIQSKYYSAKTHFGSYTGTECNFSRIIHRYGLMFIGIFSTASMSFRDIPLSSLRIIVYSRILIFSAFETVVWFLWVWILGFRTLFFLFRTYRGMQLWWDSSTYIWANERGCIKYLCFFHIRDYLCRGSRRALGPQWKLLSTSDSNHSLYAQKGSFAFTPGQARQAYNKHCLHK